MSEEEANEKKLKQAEEREKRMRKEFQFARQQSTSQLARTAQRSQTIATLDHHQQSATAAGNGHVGKGNRNFQSSNLIASTALVLDTLAREKGTAVGSKSLEGAELLDVLIANYSSISGSDRSIGGQIDGHELYQTLSLLTQSIVLQMNLPEPENRRAIWSSVAKIANRLTKSPQQLVQSLRYISQDMELIQELLFTGQSSLLQPMTDAILEKTSGDAVDIMTTKGDVISVLCGFHHLEWDYDHLKELLEPLDGETTSSSHQTTPINNNSAAKLLVRFLRDQLIRSVARMMIAKSSANSKIDRAQNTDDDESMVQSQETVLQSLLDHCHSFDSTFFDPLMEKLADAKTGDKVDAAFADFVNRQLGVDDDLRQLMPHSSAKLRFILTYTRVGINQLDLIRKSILESGTAFQEPYQSIYSLTEQAFVNYHWTREWQEIDDILNQIGQSDAIMQLDAGLSVSNFRTRANRLKAALIWPNSGKTYDEIIKCCTKLKDILLNRSSGLIDGAKSLVDRQKETPLAKGLKFIGQIEDDLVGGETTDQDEQGSKDSFLKFTFHLQTLHQSKKLDEKLLAPQFRKALYYLDHHRTVSFAKNEIQLFNQVFDRDWNLKNLKSDHLLRHMLQLKKEYLDHFPDRYFLRWMDCYEKAIEIQKEIRHSLESCDDDKNGSSSSSVDQVNNVLLSRYLILTTFFLSPNQCLEEWKSLRVDKLDRNKLQEKAAAQFGNQLSKIIDDVQLALNQQKTMEDAAPKGLYRYIELGIVIDQNRLEKSYSIRLFM